MGVFLHSLCWSILVLGKILSSSQVFLPADSLCLEFLYLQIQVQPTVPVKVSILWNLKLQWFFLGCLPLICGTVWFITIGSQNIDFKHLVLTSPRK